VGHEDAFQLGGRHLEALVFDEFWSDERRPQLLVNNLRMRTEALETRKISGAMEHGLRVLEIILEKKN
jgi:hypothetical protein